MGDCSARGAVTDKTADGPAALHGMRASWKKRPKAWLPTNRGVMGTLLPPEQKHTSVLAIQVQFAT